VPLPLTGTAGAFIRIREPITTKPALFDIGIAGPIAGFVVAVPALFLGLSLSRVVDLPADFSGLSLGEPLLFQWAARLVWGAVPDHQSINLHPMAFAAWFGLLATALNLFPIGQFDGGHIAYAALGRRSSVVTVATVGAAVGLSFYSSSWIVWTAVAVGLLFAFGWRHPRTWDEDAPLDRRRLWLALLALVIFAICFTPAPIEPLDLIQPQ
jgi:membrane-associated protease RseP (regulator of RpoE activity)